MSEQDNQKRRAGEYAARLVEPGMWVGLGTGSTVRFALDALEQRWRVEPLRFTATATSVATEDRARAIGIPLVPLTRPDAIDLTIDGADEVARDWALIKGGGGALLREKLVAQASRIFVVVVDSAKLVDRLGRHAVPVEVVPFGWEATQSRIAAEGGMPQLRGDIAAPFRTDNGNFILDCQFPLITNPARLHAILKLLPGVVETGLFPHFASRIIVGTEAGVRDLAASV